MYDRRLVLRRRRTRRVRRWKTRPWHACGQSSRCCLWTVRAACRAISPWRGRWPYPSRVRMRMRSASNSAKVARILKNVFPVGPHGSKSARPRASFTSRSRSPSALEYRPSRRSALTAETRWADRRVRAPGPHLTPWVGPHILLTGEYRWPKRR